MRLCPQFTLGFGGVVCGPIGPIGSSKLANRARRLFACLLRSLIGFGPARACKGHS